MVDMMQAQARATLDNTRMPTEMLSIDSTDQGQGEQTGFTPCNLYCKNVENQPDKLDTLWQLLSFRKS